MTRAAQIVAEIEAQGGRLAVEDDRLVIDPSQVALPFVDELRLHKQEIILLLREREASDFDPLDRFREGFAAWIAARVWVDTKRIASHDLNPRWFTGIGSLYKDCCAWMVEHAPVVPPNASEFELLLRELGCTLQTVGDTTLIGHAVLKEDKRAHEGFEKFPLPDPIPPASAPVATLPDGTPLPAGIIVPAGCRITRWRLKEMPVRLTQDLTITDAEEFARITLLQLGDEMCGQNWLGNGMWGGVSLLVDKLRAVGVEVATPEPPKPGGAR
jgi:hypothetical protein